MNDQIFNAKNLDWRKLDVGKMKYLMGPEFSKSARARILQLDPGDHFTSHEHDFIQCMYFINGQGDVSLDDRKEKIVPGLTVIVLPKQGHSVVNRGPTQMEIIVFESFDIHPSETPFVDF